MLIGNVVDGESDDMSDYPVCSFLQLQYVASFSKENIQPHNGVQMYYGYVISQRLQSSSDIDRRRRRI